MPAVELELAGNKNLRQAEKCKYQPTRRSLLDSLVGTSSVLCLQNSDQSGAVVWEQNFAHATPFCTCNTPSSTQYPAGHDIAGINRVCSRVWLRPWCLGHLLFLQFPCIIYFQPAGLTLVSVSLLAATVNLLAATVNHTTLSGSEVRSKTTG